MVAQDGVEPTTLGYEPSIMPFNYRASDLAVDTSRMTTTARSNSIVVASPCANALWVYVILLIQTKLRNPHTSHRCHASFYIKSRGNFLDPSRVASPGEARKHVTVSLINLVGCLGVEPKPVGLRVRYATITPASQRCDLEPH